jgi:hypothetical protein
MKINKNKYQAPSANFNNMRRAAAATSKYNPPAAGPTVGFVVLFPLAKGSRGVLSSYGRLT